jgi:hypothetical protein
MLDKVIHSHHDKIEDIQETIHKEIETIIQNIDIDAIIENPKQELLLIIDVINELILNEYMQKAVETGIEFSKSINKAKEILIDKTKDPSVNESLDDKS